jgi:RNA polymerase sigma factor (sigma-70 family)
MSRILSFYNTEAQFISALRNSDPKAQRKLYEKYSNKMMGICYRYLNDEVVAEDIMIEGFMKIFNCINQFNESGSLEGWMRRIMVNESLGYLRKHKNSFFEGFSEDILNLSDGQVGDAHFNAQELMDMIQLLPLGYKTVFNLYAIEGYAHIEIAEMLNISESTSKSQLHRARTALQKMVLQEEQARK